MLPYGLKVPAPYFPFGPTGSLTQAHLSSLDFQSTQLNDYNVRVQLGLRNYQNSLGLSPFHAYISDPYTQAYFYKHDPRARFVQEEPKPSHSYIGLIGMAILNSKEKKLVLSDIYQWILDNYPYFRTRGPGWRNSIRHNLSLNDCFIKSGRSANGKGHYWAVHPANVDDFERGDFRRRRAQRKVRRHMGLSVPDDDDSPTASPIQRWSHHDATQESDRSQLDSLASSDDHALTPASPRSETDQLLLLHQAPKYGNAQVQPRRQSRKRLFDMASLLAPDDDEHDANSDQQPNVDKLRHQDINVSHANLYLAREMKKEDSKLIKVVDNSKDNNEARTHDDVDMTVSHLSSESERELDGSDEDCEQDEIQVTSGDDSPEHETNRQDDKCQGQSDSSIYINASKMKPKNGGKVYTQRHDHKLLKWHSSLYKIKPRTDGDANVASLVQPENEKNLTMFSSKNHQSKLIELNFVKKSDIFQPSMADEQFDGTNKKDSTSESTHSYSEVRAAGNSTIANQSKAKNYNNDFQKVICQLSHEKPSEFREELSSLATGALEHMKRAAGEYHYYRSEFPGSNQQIGQDNGFSLASTKDNGLVNHTRNIQTETTRSICDIPASDSRLTSDQLGWFEMSNSLLHRDRLCGFGTLGMKNSGIYSPIEFRNAQLGSQRFQPITTSVAAETATSLISVSAPSSLSTTSINNGLDIAVTKSCHQISRSTCSSIPDSVSGRLET